MYSQHVSATDEVGGEQDPLSPGGFDFSELSRTAGMLCEGNILHDISDHSKRFRGAHYHVNKVGCYRLGPDCDSATETL